MKEKLTFFNSTIENKTFRNKKIYFKDCGVVNCVFENCIIFADKSTISYSAIFGKYLKGFFDRTKFKDNAITCKKLSLILDYSKLIDNIYNGDIAFNVETDNSKLDFYKVKTPHGVDVYLYYNHKSERIINFYDENLKSLGSIDLESEKYFPLKELKLFLK